MHGSAALQLLAAEMLGLAIMVLALFWLRRRFGLTPLYVSLGVFQPIQVLLSSSIYVDLWPGVPVSPGTLMFAASLLAVLLVYLREDAIEARKVIYGIIGANLIMTLVMFMASVQLKTPGTMNLLGLAPEIFSQGARVTAVGTLVFFVDVVLLILLYTAVQHYFPRRPFLRVFVTMAGVLAFDAVAFTTGAFFERADFPSLLFAAVLSKLLIASLFSAVLIFYLRFIEPSEIAGAAPNHPLRDFFYSFTYREKFELQAQKTDEVEARLEKAQQVARMGFLDWNLKTDIIYWSDEMVRLIGFEPGQNLQTLEYTATLVHPDDRAIAQESIQRAVSGTAAHSLDHRMLRADGTVMWVHAEGELIYDQAGDPSRFLGTLVDITERIERQNDLVHRANHDELTGLANRRATREALDASLTDSRSQALQVGVIVLNIDRLHHVNDTLGYGAGDQVLVQVGQRLRRLAAAIGCTVGRIAGDEFLLMTGSNEFVGSFETIAREARHVLAQPYMVDGQSVYLTCSAGVSWSPDAGSDAAQLLGQADLALNLAKQRGRNQVVLYSAERSADLADRIGVGAEMREALQRQEMQLHYQPLIDVVHGTIAGAEALMRWDSAKLGSIGPCRFIPIAEDTGMIIRLGDWALRSAITQISDWRAAGRRVVPLSVNVSAVQFQRPEFIEEIEDALRQAGVAPELLKIEITESVVMEDAQTAVMMLNRLKQFGVRISLDDFGTGHSSLGYLRQLPIDEIKIDQSFVRDVIDDSYAATLCRAIIAMSQQLHFTVVAEGVETEAQAHFLKEAGCHLLQGYLFSKAVPADKLGDLLVGDVRWSLDGRRATAVTQSTEQPN